MADLVFVGQFVASKVGATGLTVTVDVDRYTLADGTRAALVTGGNASEGRRGLYHYRLASADPSLYQYVATFVTADTDVDQQEIAALGLVVPDALISAIPEHVLAAVYEGTETFQDFMRLARAVLLGLAVVDGNTVAYRDASDGKDRVVVEVDRQGNRTGVTADAT